MPGPCQQLPELPVPLFLGQRHLAMLIFARHSAANQAGFASPHPRISALRSTIEGLFAVWASGSERRTRKQDGRLVIGRCASRRLLPFATVA